MAVSLNAEIADLATAHAVDLERLIAGSNKSVLSFLKELETDLVKQIAAVDPTGVTRTAFQQARLEALLKQTRASIASTYKAIPARLKPAYVELAEYEAAWTREMVNRPVGVDLASVTLSKDLLESIVSNTMIDGAPSAEWWKKQGEQLRDKFTR